MGERDKLLALSHLNAALCHLVTGNNAGAISDSTKALGKGGGALTDASRAKALFFRAQANAKLLKWDLSLQDLNEALVLQPGDAAIQNDQRKAANQLKIPMKQVAFEVAKGAGKGGYSSTNKKDVLSVRKQDLPAAAAAAAAVAAR